MYFSCVQSSLAAQPSLVYVFAFLAMSQKKGKGNRLDSIPRLGKQVWRRANVKGSRRKLLVDRITEVLKLASGENGDDEVGSKLEDESAVHCPSAQTGSYSANWRVLSKVGDIVLFAGQHGSLSWGRMVW